MEYRYNNIVWKAHCSTIAVFYNDSKHLFWFSIFHFVSDIMFSFGLRYNINKTGRLSIEYGLNSHDTAVVENTNNTFPVMPSFPRQLGRRSLSTSTRSRRSSPSSSYRDTSRQRPEVSDRPLRRDSPSRRHLGSPRPVLRNRARPSSPSPTRPHPRKRFGLNVPTLNQPKVIGKFDFEDKYPEDPINEEMSSNARVWRANLDECEVFDNDMVTEARDGLDLLLVFAALFSAVLTTFVVQTSQALSANFPAISTSLLVEMVTLQRAQMNGTLVESIPFTDTASIPSSFDIWVNILWFTSLTLSLGTALVAVLIKQWLYQYMSMISGTARDRSLIRYYRFEGLQKWHVLVIIGTLPIILHVALGLFLAGLTLFLIPLHVPLACVVGSITLTIYVMYAISNILPIIYIQCPYRTPFSDNLNVLVRPIRTWLSLTSFDRTCVVDASTIPTNDTFQSLKEAERVAATGNTVAEDVACGALMWLYQTTSNPPTKSVILDSLGCLSDAVSERLEVVADDLSLALSSSILTSGQERRAERLLRATRHSTISYSWWTLDPDAFETPFQTLASLLTHTRCLSVTMESEDWDRICLLVHLIRQHIVGKPILLPPTLWNRLLSSAHSRYGPKLPEFDDDELILLLCQLVLKCSFNTEREITPFTGAVEITHQAVPLLKFVIDLLVSRSPVGYTEPCDHPFARLLIIHDYVMRCLDLDSSSDTAISVLDDVWTLIRNGSVPGNDKTICRRAESVVLELIRYRRPSPNLTLDYGWCDGQVVRNATLECYCNVLSTYNLHPDGWYGVPTEFLRRLLSDLCTSRLPHNIKYNALDILSAIFSEHTDIPVDYTLLYAFPFLSTRTPSSLSFCQDCLYPVVVAFMGRFTGSNTPRNVAHQLMDVLCADPQCLFTFCRIFALGGRQWDAARYGDFRVGRQLERHLDQIFALGEDRQWNTARHEHLKQCLLDLVRLDPNHAVWTSRAHYRRMEPRDWPYLCLVEDELTDKEIVKEIKEAMMKGLEILDEFFESVDNMSTPSEPDVPIIHAPSVPYIASGAVAYQWQSWDHTELADETENMEHGLTRPLEGLSGGSTHSHSSSSDVPQTSIWTRLRSTFSGAYWQPDDGTSMLGHVKVTTSV